LLGDTWVEPRVSRDHRTSDLLGKRASTLSASDPRSAARSTLRPEAFENHIGQAHFFFPAKGLIPIQITTNQFKNGNHIDVEGTIFKILEFQHVKPGKGGAFVRTKLRRSSDGAVIDRTFRAGEKFRAVRAEVRKMQFLYGDGTDAHFMDSESFEQIAIPEATLADALKWTRPNDEVELLSIDGQPADLQLPSAVDLEVTQTEPGLRGDTASGGGTKPATLETGAQIQVPLFVNIGDKVRVDTRSGDYVSRA
jgi:elongation factor P